MKKAGIIIALILVVLILAGFLFLGSKSKQQSSQGAGTEANQEEQKNYLLLKGQTKKIEGKISPTNGTKVNGVIEVSLTKVPDKTEMVNFALIPAGKELGGQDLKTDGDGSDGWSILFDTNSEVNGLYEIIVLAEYAGRPENEGPLDFARVQVIIEN